jgi:hypothetical protein
MTLEYADKVVAIYSKALADATIAYSSSTANTLARGLSVTSKALSLRGHVIGKSLRRRCSVYLLY